MNVRVGSVVEVRPVPRVAPAWHRMRGEVVGVYGELKPFHFEVKIVGERKVWYLLFRGDELKEARG